jgi:hypothetical protein
MPFALVLLLAAGVATADPLAVDAVREPAAVEITFELVASLPDDVVAALDAGAEARLAYPIRIKAKRKAWWDRRVWSGRLVAIAAFDPVTGRYRCSVVLDGIITSTGEVASVEAARGWLTAPPPVRVELPEARRDDELRVRVRAVFATGTTWLVFPTQDATPWFEVVPTADAEPGDADG